MHHIKISPKLLERLRSQNQLDHYSVWLYLKRLYSNSCIFKYTINSLHIKSGLSRNSVRKYVAFFIKEGWCRLHSGNLVFQTHLHILNQAQAATIQIPILTHDSKGIKSALYAFLIRNNQCRQEFAMRKKIDRAKKGKSRLGERPNSLVTTTVKAASRLLHLSYRNANRILLKLQHEGWYLRTRLWRTFMSKVTPLCYSVLLDTGQCPHNHFYYRGTIVECMPSLMEWYIDPCEERSSPCK